MKIIDITQDVLEAPVYGNDPKPESERILSIKNGDGCNLSTLFSCVHNGTHTDAPLHFIEDGKGMLEVPLNAYIGECYVLEVRNGAISGEYVDEFFPDCERILLKSGGNAYFLDHGAEAAAARKYKLVGIDSQSVGTHGAQVRPHRAFLSENIAILEGLKLDDVKQGWYYLIALPMKAGNVDGSPIRAVLIEDDIFWAKGVRE